MTGGAGFMPGEDDDEPGQQPLTNEQTLRTVGLIITFITFGIPIAIALWKVALWLP